MPPQSYPLEARVADKGRVPRNGPEQTAGVQHCREELGGNVNSLESPAKAEYGVSRVFVLASNGRPLMPCHPARARKLLNKGRARVHRLIPFVIRLVDRDSGDVQPVRLKFDPGSKTTGMALVREVESEQYVLHLAELHHRGATIRKYMQRRAMYRRRRRSANLRYRAPRFNNRTRPRGWLPPSLQSRVDNTMSWVSRYRRWCPISSISVERVRFDMQQLVNPEISGIEYQQGELAGYEVREYLLEKWGRKCAYCDAKDVPLQIEHIVPKARQGSNRASNLTLACRKCNQTKGARPVEQFLANDPKRLVRIKAKAKRPLRDAAAVNATRNALYFALRATGLTVEASTGGRTKYNRSRLGVPKTHALDAAAVGDVGTLQNWRQPTLTIRATGRGSYMRTRVTKYGFPRGYLIRHKHVHGFQTGDMVKAVVLKGKKVGTHLGRVAVRASGSFNVKTRQETVQGVNWKRCQLVQRADGYSYEV